jgi:hypothetical protein
MHRSPHLEAAKHRISKGVILANGFSPTCASALIQGSYIVAFAKLRNAQLMKTERSAGQHESVKALALSVLGVMAIILIWNLVMLLLY